MSNPAETGKKQEDRDRAGRFAKGVSGNPAGAAKGSAHKVSRELMETILAAAPEVIKNIVGAAKNGDTEAQKLFLKLLPRMPRLVPTPIELPKVATAKEAAAQIVEVLVCTVGGRLDLETYTMALDGLRAFIAAYNAVELETAVEKYRELQREGE